MKMATLDDFTLENISQPLPEFFLLCNFAGKSCERSVQCACANLIVNEYCEFYISEYTCIHHYSYKHFNCQISYLKTASVVFGGGIGSFHSGSRQ
jgi:hypothetical protein